EFVRILTLGTRAAFLASRCPSTTIHQPPHSHPKQFPQLLEDHHQIPPLSPLL
ncbi:hypothetical protein BHE74_00018067, partial [Ensete ventricosum]